MRKVLQNRVMDLERKAVFSGQDGPSERRGVLLRNIRREIEGEDELGPPEPVPPPGPDRRPFSSELRRRLEEMVADLASGDATRRHPAPAGWPS